jgi:hypothetical protein
MSTTSNPDDWNMTQLFEPIRIDWLTLPYYRINAGSLGILASGVQRGATPRGARRAFARIVL